MADLNEVARDTIKGSLIHSLVKQSRLDETLIQFIGEDAQGKIAAPAGALEFDLEVQVTLGSGAQSIFADQAVPDRPAIKEVTVRIVGTGTATGKSLSAGAGSQGTVQAGGQEFVLKLVEGRGSVKLTVGSTGTVDLDLIDSEGSGLNTSDVVELTFSS